MKEPVRLRSLSELPNGLASALDAAPGGPSETELAFLAAKVGAAVGVPLAAPPALVPGSVLAAGKSTTAILAAKPLVPWMAWVMGGVVLGAGLSGAVTWWTTASDQPAPSAKVEAPRVHTEPAPPAAIEQPRDASPEAPRPTAPPPPPRSRAAAAPSSDTSGLVAPSAPEARTELELLREARRALEHDAARTLELCLEHARSHPQGALGQERDVLQVDALMRLGRLAEARARFADFERAYPHSAHAPRLRGQLDEKSTSGEGRRSE